MENNCSRIILEELTKTIRSLITVISFGKTIRFQAFHLMKFCGTFDLCDLGSIRINLCTAVTQGI
jgi:hypothetical protein